MQYVIRTSDGRVFARGSLCAFDSTKIVSPSGNAFYTAFGSNAPTQAQLEVIDTSEVVSGFFHPGWSHQWNGSAFEAVSGYEQPVSQSTSSGRDLTMREFLSVCTEVDAVKTNTILTKLPLATQFLEDYRDKAGIQFADIDVPTSKLAILLEMASNYVVLDEPVIEDIKAKWIELYPKV